MLFRSEGDAKLNGQCYAGTYTPSPFLSLSRTHSSHLHSHHTLHCTLTLSLSHRTILKDTSTHPINTHHQCTLSTHSINPPYDTTYQHLINTSYQCTLSTHPITTHPLIGLDGTGVLRVYSGHLLTSPIDTSSNPLYNTPYQQTLSPHNLSTSLSHLRNTPYQPILSPHTLS